jgi:hypothetical protein
MKAGSFNINDYLGKLYENVEGGNLPAGQQDGILIHDGDKKSFSWLKKEFDKRRVEVKVEIKMSGTNFQPGYELQTDLKSVKDFKPGMYGEVKTSDSNGAKNVEKEIEKPGDESKPEAEKKAEKSTGGEKPNKSPIGAKIKTAGNAVEKQKLKKEEKEDDAA